MTENSEGGSGEETKKSIDRRRFIKSLFGGLGSGAGSAISDQPANAAVSTAGVSFFWTNLRNGQVGFPTGTSVPSGQPGSLMKLVTAAALQEIGVITGEEFIECRGSTEINKQTYSCLYPHGKVALIQAIGLSCNVFFALESRKLNPGAIIEYAHMFGLDSPVDGYKAGGFPDGKSSKYDSTQYALGLADDLRPNALQLLRVAAAVALQGAVPGMHNTGNIEGDHTDPPFHVELKPATWHVLQQGMRLCDREGTAKHLDPEDKLELATKTGTAPHGKAFQSWVAGYFPYASPKYAFCLRSPSGTSVDHAIPAAHKWLFSAEWI